jgi:hypothetical protein
MRNKHKDENEEVKPVVVTTDAPVVVVPESTPAAPATKTARSATHETGAAPMMGGTPGVPSVAPAAGVQHPDDVAAAPPPETRWRVLADASFMTNNCRTVLRAGKILSSSHYDVEKVRAQGIQLAKVD